VRAFQVKLSPRSPGKCHWRGCDSAGSRVGASAELRAGDGEEARGIVEGQANGAVFSVQALFHLDTRACRTIQQSFEVEACELVFRLLSEVSGERCNGAWIAGCELGKSTQVTLGRGCVRLFSVKWL
jgi:hypothetical protein